MEERRDVPSSGGHEQNPRSGLATPEVLPILTFRYVPSRPRFRYFQDGKHPVSRSGTGLVLSLIVLQLGTVLVHVCLLSPFLLSRPHSDGPKRLVDSGNGKDTGTRSTN